MATPSSVLAWKIPWTKEPGGLQSMGSQSQTRLSTHSSTAVPQRNKNTAVRRNPVNRRIRCGRQVPAWSRFKVTESQVTQDVARVRASDLF